MVKAIQSSSPSHLAVRDSLAPPFWRDRFGAAVLAQDILAQDILAQRDTQYILCTI